MSEHSAESGLLTEAAFWMRGASLKCCECTDGHHDQRYAYGTEDQVRISRDTARALAYWLDEAGEARRLGTDLSPEALAVARGVLTGSVIPPGSPAATTEATT